MIAKFEVRNMTTDDRITFGQDLDCDFLYQSKGVDWGKVDANHNTYNYPNQVGVSIYSSKLKPRDVLITAWVYYVLTAQERRDVESKDWENYAYEKIKQKKDILSSVFNPVDILRLSMNGYYIEGKANSSVEFGIEESDNNLYFCKFHTSIYCNDPMFKKATIVKKAVTGDTPTWSFPWVLTESGSVFGTRIEFLTISIENEGNVAIGGKVILSAKGEVVNPTIVNAATNEKIVINKTMSAGEKITIITTPGKERGVIGNVEGIESDYIQYWSFDNTWLQFAKGVTVLNYTTANQAETKLEVSIEINPQKYNLEEM